MCNSVTRFALLSECARVLASLSERLTIRKAMRGRIALQKDFVRNRLMRRFRRSHGFGHRFEHSTKIAVG
jgi:hypothetical protein